MQQRCSRKNIKISEKRMLVVRLPTGEKMLLSFFENKKYGISENTMYIKLMDENGVIANTDVNASPTKIDVTAGRVNLS